MKRLLCALFASAAMVGAAQAATVSTSISITGTIAATCTISSSGALAFGALNAEDANGASASATITSKCSNGAAYSLQPHSDGSAFNQDSSKAMNVGSVGNPVLLYLFRADGTTPFTMSSPIAMTGTGADQTTTIVGKLTYGSGFFGALSGTFSPTAVY